MGEIAQNCQDGKQCSECGVIFERKHYYPVLCDDCYNGYLDIGETPSLPRTKHVEL